MKILPVGDRVVLCGRTDVRKVTITFRNFANQPYIMSGKQRVISTALLKFASNTVRL